MTLKAHLLQQCLELVDNRIKEIQQSIKHFQQAANEDSKSSMGDKYETNRAMMHLEKEKASSQLNQYLKMRQVLDSIRIKKSEKVEIGSIVKTQNGTYFISVGLGPLDVDGEKYFVISAASPIGQELIGKKMGDTIIFRGQKDQILEIE